MRQQLPDRQLATSRWILAVALAKLGESAEAVLVFEEVLARQSTTSARRPPEARSNGLHDVSATRRGG